MPTSSTAALSGRVRPSLAEWGATAILLMVLTTALFLPHITHGGLYYDDWESVSLARFDTHGLFHVLLPSWTNPGNRPLHNVVYSIALALLGDHQHAFPTYTALATLAVSLTLYAALRTLSMKPIHAAVISGLVVVYPFADSTHLWFSATDSDGTIVLYLLGVIVAIHGLRRHGWAGAIYHTGAVILFACSIMLYETTASVIMLTGALYWWSAGRHAALPRWSADVGCTLILLLLFARHSSLPRIHGVSALVQHAQSIKDESLTLLAHTVVPLGVNQTIVLGGIALILVGTLIACWRMPRENPTRIMLRGWLLIVVGSLIFTAAAEAMFIPAAPYYVPLAEGVGNRVNGVPALGLVAATVGIYMIIGITVACALRAMRRLVPRRSGQMHHLRTHLAIMIGVLLALLTGVRWAQLVRRDVSAWDLASSYQLRALGRIHALVPHLGHHSVLLVFGGPAYTQPGVPVFAATWDLNGAIQVSYKDFTLSAIPVISGSSLTCTATGIVSNPAPGPSTVFPYNDAVLVEVASGAVSRPATPNQCRKALPAYTPGALTVLAPPTV
jgi:hypothetical protein